MFIFACHLWVIWAVLKITWLFATLSSQGGSSAELGWAPCLILAGSTLPFKELRGKLSLPGLSFSVRQIQAYYHGGDRILKDRGKQGCLKPNFRTNTLSLFPHPMGFSKSQDKLFQ